MHHVSCVFSECGPVRSLNADAVVASDADGFYAVADGVGSVRSSADASQFAAVQALHLFRSDISNSLETPDWDRLISRLHDLYRDRFGDIVRVPATTLTLAVVRNRHLHFTTFGNSPIFLIDRRGIALLSREHTAVDQHRIFSNFSELKSQGGSNVLVNALGRQQPRPIAYKSIEFREPCRLVISSDGLMDVLSQDELGALSRRAQTGSDLRDEILVRGQLGHPRDNYSGVIIDILDVGNAR